MVNIDRAERANIVKVMPEGELVAIRNKTRNSSIADLIPEGGNDYNEIWSKGQVWG